MPETGPLDPASRSSISLLMPGLRFPRPCALVLFLAPLSLAAAEGGSTLSTESPFVVASDPGAAGQQSLPVEFRGVLSQGGVRYFNLVDPSTRKSAWVALNEAGPQGWIVRSCEQVGDNEQVTVEGGGRTLRLSLMRPRTGKAVAQQSAAPSQPAAAQGPVTPVVLNPTPAQQAKAQEDIMAEVRRRRLQRQQEAASARPPGQGAPPAPVPN